MLESATNSNVPASEYAPGDLTRFLTFGPLSSGFGAIPPPEKSESSTFAFQSTYMSVEKFDGIHYSGMALFKTAIILFNLMPYLARRIMG